jgi:hypothetical protein
LHFSCVAKLNPVREPGVVFFCKVQQTS